MRRERLIVAAVVVCLGAGALAVPAFGGQTAAASAVTAIKKIRSVDKRVKAADKRVKAADKRVRAADKKTIQALASASAGAPVGPKGPRGDRGERGAPFTGVNPVSYAGFASSASQAFLPPPVEDRSPAPAALSLISPGGTGRFVVEGTVDVHVQATLSLVDTKPNAGGDPGAQCGIGLDHLPNGDYPGNGITTSGSVTFTSDGQPGEPREVLTMTGVERVGEGTELPTGEYDVNVRCDGTGGAERIRYDGIDLQVKVLRR